MKVSRIMITKAREESVEVANVWKLALNVSTSNNQNRK